MSLIIFGQKMIKGLILARPQIFWDRFPPFFGIGELRINVINDAPKRKEPVANDLSDSKLRCLIEHERALLS
jgi:hypothetical protein